MADVLSVKNHRDGSILIELEASYDEFLNLKGAVDKIRIFSEDSADIITRLTQRGSKEATKYFLVPKELRENLNLNGEVRCQRLELDENLFFIYMIKK